MYINFVMSSYVESKIFSDIFNYFQKFSQLKCIRTLHSLDSANVYYYFRPHLEKKLKENSIVTVHHDLLESDCNLDITIFLERYREAKVVICLNSVQENILHDYGVYHTIIIPHGYNDNILKMKIKKQNSRITLGFFSSYYPRLVKGEDYLLSLFENISRDEFNFVLVGRKREKLAMTLTEYGFNCKLYTSLPYFMFNLLYDSIDCLLITSKFEGGPASLSEALSTGTPVITTKVGIVNDFLEDKGILVFTGKIDKDVKLLKSLKNNLTMMNRYINSNTKYKLITWREVISLYDQEFVKISNKKIFLNKNYYFQTIEYKLHTLYLKKRINRLFTSYLNLYRLLIANK